MRRNQEERIYIGYNKEEDFRILISAPDMFEADYLAKQYLKDSNMNGYFQITEAKCNISQLRIDCDYLIESNEEDIKYIENYKKAGGVNNSFNEFNSNQYYLYADRENIDIDF